MENTNEDEEDLKIIKFVDENPQLKRSNPTNAKVWAIIAEKLGYASWENAPEEDETVEPVEEEPVEEPSAKKMRLTGKLNFVFVFRSPLFALAYIIIL